MSTNWKDILVQPGFLCIFFYFFFLLFVEILDMSSYNLLYIKHAALG